MRLRDRMIRRYAEWDYTGAQLVGGVDGYGQLREGPAAGLALKAREAFRASGVVFGCLVTRIGLFSEARFQFQSVTDRHLFGDTTLSLLEHPWPNGDTGDLLARLETDVCVAGNAYIRKVQPGDGSPPFLLRMPPQNVTIVSEERADDMGRAYKIPVGYLEDVAPRAGGMREPRHYDITEVAHYAPVPDPDAAWRGMSWLSPILREIRADFSLTSYRTWHLDNGAMPGLVIKSPRKLSDLAVETLRKRLTARHAGPENAGKTIVLDEGNDVTVAGSTLQELQLEAVAAVGEKRICSAGQVPLEIMGLAPGPYQDAMRRFADLWARPSWRMACAALQHLVPDMPPAGVRLWYDVSDIAALREGELSRGQTTLVKLQAVASAVMAGYTRESAVLAAESGDLSVLVPDPNAPTPGMAGRVSETERLGQGQAGQPVAGPGETAAPAGPGGGALNGRAPQAGLPQNLPGRPQGTRLPPAGLPRVPVTPAIPAGGPRGPRGTLSAAAAGRSQDTGQ